MTHIMKIDEMYQSIMNEDAGGNTIVVYRAMDKNGGVDDNVWVTDSERYAKEFAETEYRRNGVVRKFALPRSVVSDLCFDEEFEEIMNEEGEWQEIPDDSPLWENGDCDDYEYDLQHDMCFPSDRQISILKRKGYKGICFEFNTGELSILLFDGNVLEPL